MAFSSSSSPTMVSAALTYLEKTPRRSIVLFLMRWYTIILGIMVSLIMLVGAWSFAPWWTLFWILLYWIYYVAKFWAQGRVFLGVSFYSIWFHFWRSLLLMSGVTSFLAYLYFYTDYLAVMHTDSTLWLLFVLPVFIISQRSNFKLLLAAIVIATTLLAYLSFQSTPHINAKFFRDVGVKIFWLTLLPIILHVLIHFVSDWYTNIRILYDIERKIVPFRTISEETRLLETVVQQIAESFNYPHVNIFLLQPDGTLCSVAGSGAAGKTLVQKKFTVHPNQGIVGYVLQTQKIYLSNNVERDPHYSPHPAFPQTKAELAVPINLDNQTLGIMDIQAHQTGVFLPQDVEVMEVMASHCGIVLDNLRLIRSKQRIDKIVDSIAHRFLSQSELNYTLDEIAKTAREELYADVVVLYERNPLTNKIIGPTYAGDLYYPDIFAATAFEPDSIVQRLLLVADKDYFQENVLEISEVQAGFFQNKNTSDKSTFVEREKIKSRAILRLQTDIDCLGLMFLNFRSCRRFDEQEKAAFFSFAHLAALAIQKAQFHQQQIEFERKNLARQLHDQLMANADATSRIISLLLRDGNCQVYQQTQLLIARDAIQELKRDIRFLNDTLKDTILDNLTEEVDKLVYRARNAYGANIRVNWVGKSNYVPPALVAQLKLILNEAIVNAIRHGEAAQINLDLTISSRRLTVSIQDNGRGFDPVRVKPGGLVNMRERTERLSGQFSVTSVPGKGTNILINIPYDPLKGENNA